MKTVAVVAVAPVKPFELAMPGTMLGTVTVDGEPCYRMVVCTAEPGVVPGALGGFDVVVPRGLDALDEADTVIVPSTGSRGTADAATVAALRRAVDQGKRVTSICSGAFVLAQAGLLSGRTATTHWGLADELAAMFPDVTVRSDALFIEDGPVTTAAGAAAGIDLCLHLIRTDYGATVANAAARAAVVTPVRPGGQAQFADSPLPPENGLTLSAPHLGPGTPRHSPVPGRSGHSRPHQRAHPHPPLPRGNRPQPPEMATAPTHSARPRTPRIHHIAHGPGSPPQRHRLRGIPAPTHDPPRRPPPERLPRLLHPHPAPIRMSEPDTAIPE